MYQQAQLYNSSPGFIRSGRSSLLRHAPSGVVRVSEAARAWGRPTSSASRRLGALTRSGWIRRVRRGVYQTDPLPDSPPRSFISSFAIARGARTAQRHATKPEKGDAAKRRGSIRARLRASDEAQTGAWFYKPISHALVHSASTRYWQRRSSLRGCRDSRTGPYFRADSRIARRLTARSMTRWASGLRNLQVTADLPREIVVDLPVARNSRALAHGAIDVNRMSATLTEEHAAARLQMPDELDPLHADMPSGSRMTSAPTKSSSARVRLASSTSSTASRKLALASSSVVPWLFAPGSSSTNAR